MTFKKNKCLVSVVTGRSNIVRAIRISGLLLWTVSTASSAADVAVRVTGTVLDNTCVVGGNGLSQVDMGYADTRFIRRSGDVAYPVRFSLMLQNCGPAAKGVSMTFSGQGDTNNRDVLALENIPEKAGNIGLQLLDKNRHPLVLEKSSSVYPLIAGSGQAELIFYARFIATADGTTPGIAKTTATVSFTYK